MSGEHQNKTSGLVRTLRTYEAANGEVGGRRDLIDTIWIIKTELAQHPVRDRLAAGYDG